MEHIDVADLPAPVARAIEAMVQALRQELRTSGPKKETKDLPLWEGHVIGNLTREEIYDDVV